MGTHSKLAPSAAERWINCPASVRLSEGFEDTQSPYAAEGTTAHRLAELKLRRLVMGEEVPEADFEAVREDPMYDPEMEEYTDEYVERIRAVKEKTGDAYVLAETRVDLSQAGAPDIYGTADCIVCAPGRLEVFDFKYGKNVEVPAEGNPQMLIYAAGAYLAHDWIFGIESVGAHIVQPRMNNYPDTEIGSGDLMDWIGREVVPKAKKAMAGTDSPKAGPWCRFCLAKPVCRAHGDPFESVEIGPDPDRLTNAEVAERIKALDGVDAYLKELKEYALKAVLDGGEVPGFKAVEGRSTRVWRDQEAAFTAAENDGVAREALFERKPLSLSKIEKMMGKKRFAEVLGEYVDKPQGKPTLVRDTDSRPPFKRRTAAEEFADMQVGFDLNMKEAN